MRNLIVTIFILISVIIQVNILPSISLFSIKPDLLLILMIFFNLHFSFKKGLVFGGICGLLKDVLSVGALGVNLFSFIICAFVIRGIKQNFYEDSFPMRAFVVFLVSLLNSTINCILLNVVSEVNFSILVFVVIILGSFYTTLFSLLVFIPFRRCVLKLFT